MHRCKATARDKATAWGKAMHHCKAKRLSKLPMLRCRISRCKCSKCTCSMRRWCGMPGPGMPGMRRISRWPIGACRVRLCRVRLCRVCRVCHMLSITIGRPKAQPEKRRNDLLSKCEGVTMCALVSCASRHGRAPWFVWDAKMRVRKKQWCQWLAPFSCHQSIHP